MPTLRALTGAAAGLAVGLVVGVVGVLWHHAHVVVGQDRWPVGVVLVVLMAGAAAVAVGAGTSGPTALVLFVLAIAATEVAASSGGPGGDVLVVDDLLGQAYLLGTGLAAVVALVLVRRVRRTEARRRAEQVGHRIARTAQVAP